jgi:hypothetical protein
VLAPPLSNGWCGALPRAHAAHAPATPPQQATQTSTGITTAAMSTPITIPAMAPPFIASLLPEDAPGAGPTRANTPDATLELSDEKENFSEVHPAGTVREKGDKSPERVLSKLHPVPAVP